MLYQVPYYSIEYNTLQYNMYGIVPLPSAAWPVAPRRASSARPRSGFLAWQPLGVPPPVPRTTAEPALLARTFVSPQRHLQHHDKTQNRTGSKQPLNNGMEYDVFEIQLD